MVDESDVFVGVSYSTKLQYEELKKVVDRASDSFNKFGFGVQSKISGSVIYVMHFPVRGYASIRVKELKIVKKLAGL